MKICFKRIFEFVWRSNHKHTTTSQLLFLAPSVRWEIKEPSKSFFIISIAVEIFLILIFSDILIGQIILIWMLKIKFIVLFSWLRTIQHGTKCECYDNGSNSRHRPSGARNLASARKLRNTIRTSSIRMKDNSRQWVCHWQPTSR